MDSKKLINGNDSQIEDGFLKLGLQDILLKSIEEDGYKKPTPIQERCIPLLLNGYDVLGLAQTGSGKTAAFCLPFLQKIDCTDNNIQILIITPTRELAKQVSIAINKYAKNIADFKAIAIYGGQRYDLQIKELREKPKAIVGTPGRIIDLINSKSLNLTKVKMLVLDEADEMLRMGFIEPITEILSKLPENRQTALFSATMPAPIRKISKNFMRDPKEVRIENTSKASLDVKQFYCTIDINKKDLALARFLEFLNYDSAIVFTKTKTSTQEVANFLLNEGYKVAALNGDMTQNAREFTLNQFKSKQIKILIATDVAARGLDVAGLDWVINYDLPSDSETYVHRVGRTGRAGRAGQALLFVEPKKFYLLSKLEKFLNIRLEQLFVPKVSELIDKRIDNWKDLLSNAISNEDKQLSIILDKLSKSINITDFKLLSLAMFKIAHDQNKIIKHYEKDFVATTVSREKNNSLQNRGNVGRKLFGKINIGYGYSKKQLNTYSNGDNQMVTYSVNIGSNDGLEAKHIFGALVNEGGLSSRSIGSIKLFNDKSYLELDGKIKPSKISYLSKIRVFNKQLVLNLISKKN